MVNMNCKGLKNKAVSLLMVSAMGMSLVACADKDKEDNKKEEVKEYTYNIAVKEYVSNWNPHILNLSGDSVVDTYCEMGLVAATADETGALQWTFEMAEDIKDITSTFSDKEKYKIAEGETGRVWQIKLNKNACWEDGTVINADTYIESMKLLLDPEMKNSGADIYVDFNTSDISIYNAMNYFYPEKAGQTVLYSFANKKFESVEDAVAVGYAEENIYLDIKGFWGVGPDNAEGMLPITDETGYDYEGRTISAKQIYETFLAPGCPYESRVQDYLYVADGNYEQISFDKVGIAKVDDYTINYITSKSVTADEFYSNMTDNWIVNTELYNGAMTKENGATSTAYGTSVETYSSYGPYKLVSAQGNKQYIMEKNENWYGYNDGKHEGQYQTTSIVADVIEDYDAQLEKFLNGKLDYIELEQQNLAAYSTDNRFRAIDTTYTHRWVFATDIDALTAIELELNDGSNKKVLSYDDFRKAISFAIDREAFCEEATPGYKAAYGLLSEAYYDDLTDVADFSAIEQDNRAITGYNPTEAGTLFQGVYDKAIADGNYTEGQPVTIRCMVSSADELSEENKKQETALNNMLAEAVKGTGFEGKVTVEFVCGAENRYLDLAQGNIEMIMSAWGSNDTDPFKQISCYTDPGYTGGYVHEQCGWNPTEEKLAITYDFDGDGTEETVEKTYQQWTRDINSHKVYADNEAVKPVILSALEKGVLSQYQCIPWGTETEGGLLSTQVEFEYEKYNEKYGFGDVRYMTYNYDDKAWEDKNSME